MKSNIYELFSKVKPNKTAVVYRNENISFGDIKKAVENLSKLLSSLDCNQDTIVGFLLNENPDFIISLLAISKLNSKFFVINPKNPIFLNEKILSILRPKIIVADPLMVSNLGVVTKSIKSVVNFSSSVYLLRLNVEERKIYDDTFSVLFTSGTTQLPKGVFHKQEDFIFVGEKCFSVWGINQGETLISAIPLFSAASLGCLVIPALCYGCRIVMLENRKPFTIMNAMLQHRVDFILGTPTNFIQLMQVLSNNNTASLRFPETCGTVTGACIPTGFVEKVYSTCEIQLYPHYGTTETLALTSVRRGGDRDTVGQPLDGVEIKISNDNEIIVKSFALTTGYIDDSTLSIDQDGYYHTNDLGKIDAQGNLIIFGRKDDVINRGGNNIFPSEIESALLKNTKIACCAVLGMPDAVYGQKIVAFIKPDSGQISVEEIKDFLKDYLPTFKIPDEFVFIEEIPCKENGKIKKEELKKLYLNLEDEKKTCCNYRNGYCFSDRK